MNKNKFKKVIEDCGIHYLINIKLQKTVVAYTSMISFGCSDELRNRFDKTMPSYLKYGGYRNTCYDFRSIS